jgi:P2 family phage major capsid protein
MKVLSNLGRDRLGQYFDQVAAVNDLHPGACVFSAVARNFAVEPSVQQKLVDKISEDTSFLGDVNIELVTELKGEKLGLGLDGKIISSRTDVLAAPRVPKSYWSLDDDKYECRDTHFDTFLSYAQIDKWAKFPDFSARISAHLLLAQRADRIKIGFNGKSHAPTTDRAANPLGQDVNVGWLERMRLNAPDRVLATGSTAGKITFGTHATADFKTLDALVISAVNEMIEPWHHNRSDLVVLVSRDLLEDKYFDIYNLAQPATEQLAVQALDLQRRLGRYPAKVVPWFPNGTIAITFPKNLSIYEQEGSRRRKIQDNASRSRFDDFESYNEDYVIEDYTAMCMVEKIEEKNA